MLTHAIFYCHHVYSRDNLLAVAKLITRFLKNLVVKAHTERTRHCDMNRAARPLSYTILLEEVLAEKSVRKNMADFGLKWRHVVPPAHAITTDQGSVESSYSANTPPGFSENIILLFGVLQQVFVVFDIFKIKWLLTIDWKMWKSYTLFSSVIQNKPMWKPEKFGKRRYLKPHLTGKKIILPFPGIFKLKKRTGGNKL